MPRKKVEHSSNQAPHDIESACSIVTSMTERLNGLTPLSPDCCIYKVPERLRCVNKKAYTPQVVSIGPFHHDSKDLLYMEDHKLRYLQHFLVRTGVPLEDYVRKIKDQEEKLRGCYEGKGIGLKSEFVSIILVDAAFIVELLLRNFFEDFLDNSDMMLENIARDMILLENQLPFFILEGLFEDVKSKCEKNQTLPSIIELSYKFFHDTVRLQGNEGHSEFIRSSSSKVKHFVDLIRTLHLPYSKSSQTGGPTSSCTPKVKHFCDRIRRFLPSQTEKPLEGTLNTPCAKKLYQAGVKFRVSSSKNLFDIQFNKGILEIPQVEINGYTELTLRNLLAFEQCHCRENHISDYLCFMDGFVNTQKDVDFLVEYGIVVNALGDNNKVSQLINKLCIGVSWNHKNYYFADRSKELNNYCREPWNKSKASLNQKYFNTPWAIISVFAAGFVILLSITQTVLSIISFINQLSS